MKPEYDLGNMKSRPNPYPNKLKQQVTLLLRIDVIEYFEAKANKKLFIYYQ
ncbi:BrnA antitoxin family protein [Moorena bouillonii]|nr:BrnA antitoxin family protein [Moorena bouillonii]